MYIHTFQFSEKYRSRLKFIFPHFTYFNFFFLKKINFKTFLSFFIFYITSTLFYYFLNKKLTTIDFFSSIFHINYFNFISHQSYFIIIQKQFLKREKRVKNFQTGRRLPRIFPIHILSQRYA